MAIHVQVWSGAKNARVTDMTNAGKRGKLCRQLRFSGCSSYCHDNETVLTASEHTDAILGRLEGLDPSTAFDDAVALVRNAVAECRAAGVSGQLVTFHDDEACKGIDAPREVLTAGNDKWNGSADERGIHLADLTDHFNDPRECTHGQTHAKAYAIAAKVWGEVQKAQTMHEASQILTAAGARLHYWCAVD